MLRAFRSNPSLGGFGGETTTSSQHDQRLPDATPDAFCQIIKELVDNAVDACSSNSNAQKATRDAHDVAATKQKSKRVRVDIAELGDKNNDDKGESNSSKILRVTITDNGIGMFNVQQSVGAFHTSKAHNSGSLDNGSTATLVSAAKGSISNRCKPKNRVNFSNTNTPEMQTAGRYGVGLTLCLLHAQRLVPNSCATITTSTEQMECWTKNTIIVDTESDKVRCIPDAASTSLQKSNRTESGTSISVLVPGGLVASMAWPRLSEYFARFKLSLDLTCSLEVLAPTLSRIPLLVEPSTFSSLPVRSSTVTKATKRKKSKSNSKQGANAEMMSSFINDEMFESATSRPISIDNAYNDSSKSVSAVNGNSFSSPLPENTCSTSAPSTPSNCKLRDIKIATEQFLRRPININNIAHSIVPIKQPQQRAAKTKKRKNPKLQQSGPPTPTLEVSVVIQGENSYEDDVLLNSNDDDDLQHLTVAINKGDEEENDPSKKRKSRCEYEDEDDNVASIVLVRMVNKIPLLDSAEAIACGLVQGLVSKKRMWNSFGLDVSVQYSENSDSSAPKNLMSKLPLYTVRDSDQVAPFLKQGVHDQLLKSHINSRSNEKAQASEDTNGAALDPYRIILPASIRLGNILIVVQIHAEPSTLPLPTLSKGRLPIENGAIDSALECAMTNCLSQIQLSNASLLLTAANLRLAERDARYVPAVGLAVSSILMKSGNHQHRINDIMKRWAVATKKTDDDASNGNINDDDSIALSTAEAKKSPPVGVELLGQQIETRLRLVLSIEHSNQHKNQEFSEKTKTKIATVTPVIPEKHQSLINHGTDDDESISSSNYLLLDGESIKKVVVDKDDQNIEISDAASLSSSYGDMPSVDIPWNLLGLDKHTHKNVSASPSSKMNAKKKGSRDLICNDSTDDENTYKDWM